MNMLLENKLPKDLTLKFAEVSKKYTKIYAFTMSPETAADSEPFIQKSMYRSSNESIFNVDI